MYFLVAKDATAQCMHWKNPHVAQTLDRHADIVEPTCSASRLQPPNPMKAAGALSRWSSPSALHHAETRLCTSLPFHIFFIANIARKRPELKQGKTNLGYSRYNPNVRPLSAEMLANHLPVMHHRQGQSPSN